MKTEIYAKVYICISQNFRMEQHPLCQHRTIPSGTRPVLALERRQGDQSITYFPLAHLPTPVLDVQVQDKAAQLV